MGKELLRVTGLARTVAPPRYGQAQAIAVAPWLDDLNSTPTARLAAATGARVVQAQQEALMAAAWEQVGEMQRTNQQRRRADVALAVGNALVDRHLAVMAPNRMLQVSAPSGIPTSGGKTAAAVVARVPPTTLGATFRRLQRRTGLLARRSAAIADAGISMLGLPGATGPSAMSVLSPSRLQAADPATVNAKAPAVLPFPEGDCTSDGPHERPRQPSDSPASSSRATGGRRR